MWPIPGKDGRFLGRRTGGQLVTMWQERPCLFDVMVKTHSSRSAVVKAKNEN